MTTGLPLKDPFHATRNPEVVYHYTTMETMMKIARNAEIWATSLDYLNDVTEGDHFINLVRDRIPHYIQNSSLDHQTIFGKLLDSEQSGIYKRPYVASFSLESDSLSQWRSYCPSGNGVAIGLRVECLKRSFLEKEKELDIGALLTDSPKITFGAIHYLDKSSVEEIDEEISHAVNLVKEAVSGDEYRNKKKNLGDVYLRLLIENRACFKKHNSFSNEREFRLVVSGMLSDTKYLHFRSTRSTLVPYIPLCIPKLHSSVSNASKNRALSTLYGRWDFIDRVVIGPTTNMKLSCAAVDAFFRKEQMNIEVSPSEIPYRDWEITHWTNAS